MSVITRLSDILTHNLPPPPLSRSSFSLSISPCIHTHGLCRPLSLNILCTTISYIIQTLIIACIVILLPSMAAICSWTDDSCSESFFLSFPLLYSLVLSILTASMTYPHFIYSGNTILLYLFCLAVVLDAQGDTVSLLLVVLQTMVVSAFSWVLYFVYCQFEFLWTFVFPSCQLGEPK